MSYTEDAVRLNPLEEKWKSFGWDVKTINGHSVEELLSALDETRSRKKNKPYVIIAETIKGKGAPSIESKVYWHARAPTPEEAVTIRKEIKYQREI
jgi:transketolase